MSNELIYNKIADVFDAFQDEISRELYLKRLNYNLSKTLLSLDEILIDTMPNINQEELVVTSVYDGKNVSKKFVSDRNNWVLYGTGTLGRIIYNLFNLKDVDNLVCCDKEYISEPVFYGHNVIAPQDLVNSFNGHKILVASRRYYNEIKTYLIDNDIPEEMIFTCDPFIRYGNQYFEDFIEIGEDEIFVDAGVYNAQTSADFAKHAQNYKQIYLFEPDEYNFSVSKQNLDKFCLEKAEIFNIGLWYEKTTLKFIQDNIAGGSTIDSNGNHKINVDALDNILGDTKVTFIKMDIEGAELNALKGAKNIIKKYKPKLAISIYHKDSDIIDIPTYILGLVPEYKFYLRVYGTGLFEWVLYAIPPQN